jgi:hypothetical protein
MSTHSSTIAYIECLRTEFEYLSQYISEPGWSPFDRFISGLLYKILSSPITPETSLIHLNIPSFALGPNFNEVLLYTLAVVKYEQNYITSQEEFYLPTEGDLVFRKNDIYVVKSPVGKNKWRISPAFPAKGKDGIYEVKFKEPVRLLPLKQYKYQKRATAGSLKDYQAFFRTKLNEAKLPLLSEFKHRTIVLAEGELWKINDCLPLRYFKQNGELTAHHLPIQPMIESCKDVAAVDYILYDGQEFNEMVVVGANRYRDSLPLIRNRLNAGEIERVLLIGDEPVEGATKWELTSTEIQYLRGKMVSALTIDLVSAPKLVELVEELEMVIQDYQNTLNINLKECLSWLRPYLRLAIPESQDRNNCLQYYLERILNRFAESEWDEHWYDANIYDPEKISEYSLPVQQLFLRIHRYFLANNQKWDFLCRYCEEKHLRRSWVMVGHEQQAQALVGQPIIRGVASRRWHHQTVETLSQWAESPEKYLPNQTKGMLFVPELSQSSKLLDQLSLLTIPVIILAYEGLEDQYPDYILRSYLLSEMAKVRHRDRHHWTECRLEFPPPIPLDFTNTTRIEDLFKINTEESYIPKDEVSSEWVSKPCCIRFTDQSKSDTHLNRRVERLEEDGQRNIVVVGSLMPGNRIRFYQNTDNEAFEEVIQTMDDQGLYEKIQFATRLWRGELGDIFYQYFNRDIERLYQELRRHGYTFTQQVLISYLQNNNSTRFPRYTTLKAILGLSHRFKGSESPFSSEFNQVLYYKKKDKSIRQSIGHALGSELLLFENSGTTVKEPVLSLLPDDLINNLRESIQEKIVFSVENR